MAELVKVVVDARIDIDTILSGASVVPSVGKSIQRTLYIERWGCNHVVHTRERLPDCRHAVMVFGSFSRNDIRSAVDGGFGRSVEVDYRGIGYARAKFIEQIHVSGFGCDDEIA